jgi:aldehyde dehydrogenase (NAD+)
MDIINPTNGQVIARVTLADEEDARRAIAAAKRAFTISAEPPRQSARRSCTDCMRLSPRGSTV